MLKKLSLTIVMTIMFTSKLCFPSSTKQDPINSDYDQIGKRQLVYALCLKAQKPNAAIQEFIGKTVLGDTWETDLQTCCKNTIFNPADNQLELASARMKAYCHLHVQARMQNRQDVINFIQHGK